MSRTQEGGSDLAPPASCPQEHPIDLREQKTLLHFLRRQRCVQDTCWVAGWLGLWKTHSYKPVPTLLRAPPLFKEAGCPLHPGSQGQTCMWSWGSSRIEFYKVTVGECSRRGICWMLRLTEGAVWPWEELTSVPDLMLAECWWVYVHPCTGTEAMYRPYGP